MILLLLKSKKVNHRRGKLSRAIQGKKKCLHQKREDHLREKKRGKKKRGDFDLLPHP